MAVKTLRGLLTVRTDRVTGVVRFDVHTRDRDLSLGIADRLLELINDYNLRRRQSQARAEREFVEQRLALAQSALTTGEAALSDFSRRNRRFADSPELVAEEARLQRQVSLRQQLYVTLAQSYEAAKIEEVRNTAVITIVDRPAGFVEPMSRGAVRNTTLALLVGGFVAVALALVSENLTSAQERGSQDFLEFVAIWRDMLADLKSGLFRRRKNGRV
ncbi:MAG: GNVR domain-containing protein [Candidatus Binatia bacterium]